MKPKFDNTITLGNILTILGFTGSIIAIYISMEQRMTKIEAWQEYQARQTSEIAASLKQATENQTAVNRSLDRLSFSLDRQKVP